jgi:NAD(P)-dependent dehydrogenase (short-subunit alcohol dehydrogenase family)
MELTNEKFSAYPALKQFSLEGKSAIITGSGSGLGMAVAKGFAMAGANLALVDSNLEAIEKLSKELANAGYRTLPIKANVTSAAQVKAAVKMAVKEFSSVDVLINCAGITRRMPMEEFDEEAWDLVINVNLKGTFLFTKYAAVEMLKKGKGSIVNFGSLGSVVAIPLSVAYCSSKGGVAMLTKTAACEWAKRGIRVNAVLPGTFETPLLQQCIDQNPSYGEEMLRRFPIGRFAKPEEIVGACIFLASDASSYVVGHLLAVDGGCTAY